MSRPKPKAWQRAGTESAKVDDICDARFFEKVISTHLSVYDVERSSKIRDRLAKILGAVRLALHYRSRPSGSSRKAALRTAQTTILDARKAIRALDADSRRMVRQASETDKKFSGRIKPEKIADVVKGKKMIVVDGHGDEHLSAVVEHLDALQRWLRVAVARAVASKGGKPPEPYLERAVGSLLQVWRDTMGKRQRPDKKLRPDPTSAQLLASVQSALAPILREYGHKGNLTGHVRTALYVKSA